MKYFIALTLSIVPFLAWSQQDTLLLQEYEAYYAYVDSLEQQLAYESGSINLGNSLAKLTLSEGFRYLDPLESTKILVDSWGNPPSPTLGMIIPPNVNPYSFEGWGIVITYEEDGHIDDGDIDDIDFDNFLVWMQNELVLENEDRIRMGYEPYQLAGWADAPDYDSERHQLSWGMELHFGDEEETVSTLNYNVRVLGREGVLVLNAVSGMEQLDMVKENMAVVLQNTSFMEGYRYSDFNPSVDRMAAYGIGTLVAGKMVAKTGVLSMLLAFLEQGWKFLLVIAGAAFILLRKSWTGSAKDERESV